MTILFYLIPVMVVIITPPGEDPQTYRGPSYLKWFQNPDGLAVRWSCKDYGSVDMMLCAVNAEPADHDWLAIQSDVYQFPQDIDVNVPQSSVATLQAYLEAHAVPGDWTSPSETWRSTLRTITGMFLYMQRLTAMTGNVSPLDWGYTLNTQWRNVEAEHQDAIVASAASLGYDTSFIGNNTLLRAIIKAFADVWGAAPIYFGFVTL